MYLIKTMTHYRLDINKSVPKGYIWNKLSCTRNSGSAIVLCKLRLQVQNTTLALLEYCILLKHNAILCVTHGPNSRVSRTVAAQNRAVDHLRTLHYTSK